MTAASEETGKPENAPSRRVPLGPQPIRMAAPPSPPKGRLPADFLFWATLAPVAAGYVWHLATAGFSGTHAGAVHEESFSGAIFDLMNQMWVGIVIGVVAMGAMARIPRPFIMAALGTAKGWRGIVRAVAAGVLLDLCSHGILMIGAKLYERGATAGQVMAFLIASPWNSISLTVILIALIGWGWTLAFIFLSAVIAFVTGVIVDALVERGTLPGNAARIPLPEGFAFWPEARRAWSRLRITPAFVREMLWEGLRDSRMILRWLFLGVLIAACLRALVDPSAFAAYFGPSLVGLGVTLVAATVIEVCSEGSAPVAADILTRAAAPGNGFAFMMAGVATDYTEIMVLREATRSWRIPFALPLITLPQVVLIAWLINSSFV